MTNQEYKGYGIRVFCDCFGAVRVRYWRLDAIEPLTRIPLTEYDTGIQRFDLELAVCDAKHQIDGMLVVQAK